MSASLAKMECPYCQKDVQARSMFNHIRKLHYVEFLKRTTRKFIDEAANNKPLRIYWTKMNDFDEEEEFVLYACLATNKTFTTELRANAHFAKDKKLLKDHTKQMKEIKKDYLQMKNDQEKKRQKNETQIRFFEAKRTNDPQLARALWKIILHYCRVIEVCQFLCEKRKYQPETPMWMLKGGGNRYSKHDFQETTYKVFLERQQTLLAKVHQAKQTQCLNVIELEKLWIALWNFWDVQYRENLVDFCDSLKDAMPDYWPHPCPDEFFGLANDSMPGVNF